MELMSNMAIFDTMIVVWKEKRRWDAVRPFSAIRYLYGDQVRNQTLTTLHLKIEKLSSFSPRDSNTVLHNINHCWIDPAKYFCLKSSSLSAIYDSLKIKGLKSGWIKKRSPLLISQFFISRNFVAWPKKIPSL